MINRRKKIIIISNNISSSNKTKHTKRKLCTCVCFCGRFVVDVWSISETK